MVGPNASGKSNFADAIHFLGEVYEHGLEVGVARKGGYENIAFRRQRRSKSPICFSLSIDGLLDEVSDLYSYKTAGETKSGEDATKVTCTHSFSFSAKGQSIKAPFSVQDETFECFYKEQGKSNKLILRIERGRDKRLSVRKGPNLPKHIQDKIELSLDAINNRRNTFEVPSQLLLISHFFLGGLNPFAELLIRTASRFRVFRLTPEMTRKEGVPTPNAELSFRGENLPALVDWLQDAHQNRWRSIMNTMKDVMPSLKSITVDYSPSKTLQLFFHEEKSGRPWIADDVSDGTIQTLAMLVAIFDPRGSLLLIEEPENSIHPWIIRMLIERLRELSEHRTVFLTSHSRTLIDLLNPSELFIASRSNLETSIYPIAHFDERVQEEWELGKYKLSEALDSGLIPAAVPGGIPE